MKVFVTLEIDVEENDLPKLQELGWQAATGQFTDRAEWDEYRSTGPRQPHEYDLVEIVVAGLWAGEGREVISLEDTHTRTEA